MARRGEHARGHEGATAPTASSSRGRSSRSGTRGGASTASKRYFRREMLRIGARDLMGLAARRGRDRRALVSRRRDHRDRRLHGVRGARRERRSPERRRGASIRPVPYHRFAVISLGKLGGTELNYSSDIDLMYVCEATEGERERAFYDALARRVTEYLSAPTEEGDALPRRPAAPPRRRQRPARRDARRSSQLSPAQGEAVGEAVAHQGAPRGGEPGRSATPSSRTARRRSSLPPRASIRSTRS